MPDWFLARVLEQRRFFALVVCLGTALALPSLSAGFVADDFFFLNRLRIAGSAATFSLYEFATGEPGQHERLMSNQWLSFPWWIGAGFKVRFLRPLSSALFSLDHALFGQAPAGYHVHCLVWFALLLVGVGLLLRLTCSSATWRIAFLLYALCASHAEAVTWISSRHMLVSTVPALFGLVAIVRYREHGLRAGLALGLLGMAVGLAGGEAALAVALFWLSYELLGARGGPALPRRIARAALPAATIVAYLSVYRWLGYGAAHSGAYLDPAASPLRFLASLPVRLPVLLAEIFVGFPSGVGVTLVPAPAAALGTLATLGMAWALHSRWSLLEPEDKRALLWLCVGALLALLAGAGALLGSRLVLVPGIGGFVAIACVLRHGWHGVSGAESRSVKLGRRGLCGVLVLVHLVLAPFVFVANSLLIAGLGSASTKIDASLDVLLSERHARAGKPVSVFTLTASDPFGAFYVAAVRPTRTPGVTAQWTILSLARARHRIERTAQNQLTIHFEPSMLRATFEGLFRAPDAPFKVGDRAAVAGGFVTVLVVDAGRPTSISLTLTSASFDDPEVCLLAWRNQALVPVQLALHETLDIPWSPGPTGLL